MLSSFTINLYFMDFIKFIVNILSFLALFPFQSGLVKYQVTQSKELYRVVK